jgi:threonine synthase
LLFYLTKGNHELVKQWYTSLEVGSSKRIELPREWLEQLQSEFQSSRITDDELCTTLVHVHTNFGYWADPNTGVALCTAEKLGYVDLSSSNGSSSSKTEMSSGDLHLLQSGGHVRPVALLATASPCKFEESVTTALGQDLWNEYATTDQYPASARSLYEKEERQPVVYPANEGVSFEETQLEWEQLAQRLIEKL